MRKKWISLVALLVIPGLLCITSCTKKFVISEPQHVSQQEEKLAK